MNNDAKPTTPPAMNAASPTADEKFQALIANFDAAMKDPAQRVLLETVGWLPSNRSGDQGSATSGEAVATYEQRIAADPSFNGVRSKEHMFDYLLAEIADLRAALAEKAEQSNSVEALELARQRGWMECRDAFVSATEGRVAHVAERAAAPAHESATQADQVDWLGLALDLERQAKRAGSQTIERAMLAAAHGLRLMGAPASVLEGWKLVPIKPTPAMIDAYNTAPCGFAGSPAYGGHVWEAMLDAAPEVATAAFGSEHEAHCNLRFPATLGTKDDHCDCAAPRRAAAQGERAAPSEPRVKTWQERMGLRPDFRPSEGWASSTMSMLAEIDDWRAWAAKHEP